MQISRVYFLVKDPHWAFIGWERTEELQKESKEAQLMLRIHDVTHIIFNGQNSHSYFDVEVIGETDHWYLHIPVSNRNYCVELGMKKKDGRFYLISRSNTIYLPRDYFSVDSPVEWSMIDIE